MESSIITWHFASNLTSLLGNTTSRDSMWWTGASGQTKEDHQATLRTQYGSLNTLADLKVAALFHINLHKSSTLIRCRSQTTHTPTVTWNSPASSKSLLVVTHSQLSSSAQAHLLQCSMMQWLCPLYSSVPVQRRSRTQCGSTKNFPLKLNGPLSKHNSWIQDIWHTFMHWKPNWLFDALVDRSIKPMNTSVAARKTNKMNLCVRRTSSVTNWPRKRVHLLL